MKRSLFVVYFTGTASSGVLLLYIDPPSVSGVDAGGVRYDGTLVYDEGGKCYEASISMLMPASTPLVTGETSPPAPTSLPFKILLPVELDGAVVKLTLPLGPANARFEKIKDL